MKLQIISPFKVESEAQITSISLPTRLGVVTILPYHQNMLTELVEGIVSYAEKDNNVDIAIGGGFAQTDGSTVKLLVSKAFGQGEIDSKNVDEAIARAKKILSETPDSKLRAEANVLLRRSIIESKLIKKRKGSTIVID